MLVETLRADWAARATNARVSALPEFANGALTLGAGTKLAEARPNSRDDAAEGERAVAPVSVAIGRPLDASAATHVRRALVKAREGDAPLALTHLALAGVGRLDDPREDARRLFIADGLMKAGMRAAHDRRRARRAGVRRSRLRLRPRPAARAGRERAAKRSMDERKSERRQRRRRNGVARERVRWGGHHCVTRYSNRRRFRGLAPISGSNRHGGSCRGRRLSVQRRETVRATPTWSCCRQSPTTRL